MELFANPDLGAESSLVGDLINARVFEQQMVCFIVPLCMRAIIRDEI